MKPGQPFSQAGLAIVTLGTALIIAVLWFGLHSQKKPEPAATPTVAVNSNENQLSTSGEAQSDASTNPAVAGSDAVIPISLTNFIVETGEAPGPAMQALPRGTQVYGGIEFWLQGIVTLKGQVMQNDEQATLRDSFKVPLDETNMVDGKAVVTHRGKNIACVYLIASTFYPSQPREKFAEMVWRYSDGSAVHSALEYDVHLRDWWRTPYEQPARLPSAFTKIAWHAPHPSIKDRSLRLYRVALVNPHPEKTIRSLEFVSAMAQTSLFIAALTLDPLMPGSRPDNLTSEEFTDPQLNGQLQLYVQDTDGHPLANAQIASNYKTSSGFPVGQKSATDNNGLALVRYQDTDLQTFDVSAAHEDFGGLKMLWDVQAGDTIPASYTLKLPREVKISGTVVDPDKNPISGATISVFRFWSGYDDGPDKKGEQSDFQRATLTTDADGRWHAEGLALALLDHIGFDVKHPDFIGTNITVGQNATTEKQLREGSHVIVLQRGMVVRGHVVDDSSNPVSGAMVAAGRRYFRERQVTQSDSKGSFSFKNIAGGDILFSVMAKSQGSQSKTVNVHPGMDEIIFQLKGGNTIRAHVQDESGQPVAQARVGLENNPGDTDSSAYDFTANTDAAGNFSWDGAPDASLTFYIFHDGFESKRDAKLAPNQDNIVTLRRTRQLQGQILDEDNGQPVTRFTLRTGTAAADNSTVYGIIRYHEFGAADGRFSMNLEEEADNAVMVTADGYAEKVEPFPDAQNGTVQVVVRLKPAASLNGVVLAPDGTPAPGVSVAAASSTSHGYIQLSGARLRSLDGQNKTTTTDSEGRFKLPTLPDAGSILAAGEPGFARASIAEVQNSGTITLQAWGRIEGTLKIRGQPAVGKDVLFTLEMPGVGTDFNGFKSTTDGQGLFTFEKVPPGDGAVVRLVSISPNSWINSDRTSVTVKPGETTRITIGDSGATIAGRIRFDNPPTNRSALSFEGHLSGQMPQRPAFNSPEEARAYYNSPEFQALMRLNKQYVFGVEPDGSFMVDDVAPGNYSLNISCRIGGPNLWQHPQIAQGSAAVSVPDSFDPLSPIDIGEIMLTPVSQTTH